MPYRKRKRGGPIRRRRRRRTSYTRSRKRSRYSAPRRRGRSMIMRNPFQKLKLPCRLKWVAAVSINPPIDGAQFGETAIHANSLYEVAVGDTTHQPKFYDQLSAMYLRYTVVGSKIKVTSIAARTTNNLPVVYGIWASDLGATVQASFTDFTAVIESGRNSGRSQWRNTMGTSMLANDKARSITSTFSARKHLGTPHAISDSDAGAQFGANPTDLYWYHLWVQAADQASDAQTYYFMIEMEFLVICTELRQVVLS